MVEKDPYNRTTIGFIQDKTSGPTQALGIGQISQKLDSIFQRATDRFPRLAQHLAIQPTKPVSKTFMALACASVSTAAIMANPDLAGAAVGEFEGARKIAHTATVCSEDIHCNPARKLGEFVGNFEKEFNKGRQAGLNNVLKNHRNIP